MLERRLVGQKYLLIVSEASVKDILAFLKMNATEKSILDSGNLLIVVNGKDTSVLEGFDTIVRPGDTIKIVTIVHGGLY